MYTNTYDKWLTDAEKAADSAENAVYAVSKESNSIAMAKERVRASIDETSGIDKAIYGLDHGSWDAPDVDTAMLIGEMLRAEAAVDRRAVNLIWHKNNLRFSVWCGTSNQKDEGLLQLL